MEYKRIDDDDKLLDVNRLAREGWILQRSLMVGENQLIHIMERNTKQVL